jgi:hypothetical protein
MEPVELTHDAAQGTTLSEAIRRLVEIGLKAKKT